MWDSRWPLSHQPESALCGLPCWRSNHCIPTKTSQWVDIQSSGRLTSSASVFHHIRSIVSLGSHSAPTNILCVITISNLSLVFITLAHLLQISFRICWPVSVSSWPIPHLFRSFQMRDTDSVTRILYSLVAPGRRCPAGVFRSARVPAIPPLLFSTGSL